MTSVKTLGAIVLSAALALTGIAAPAAAEGLPRGYSPYGQQQYQHPQQGWSREDQIGALIFGLAALAAISSLSDKDKDDDRRHRETPRVVQPRHDPKALPFECLNTIETWQGPVRLFGHRCMELSYRYIGHLPSHCYVEVLGRGGHKRRGWTAHCLRNSGYYAVGRH